MTKKNKKIITISDLDETELGSTNVYADLGMKDPEKLLLIAQLSVDLRKMALAVEIDFELLKKMYGDMSWVDFNKACKLVGLELGIRPAKKKE